MPDVSPTEFDATPSPPSEYSSYKLLLLSNFFFVLAGIFYILAGILDYAEQKLEANAQSDFSMAWAFLVGGAACFIVVGLLDYYNTGYKLHLLLTLAGIFGTIAAALTESNVTGSLVCNLISAHLFLAESFDWLYSLFRKGMGLQLNDSRQQSWLIAELGSLFFFLGAFMDVILSYFYLGQDTDQGMTGTQNLSTTSAEMASAVFWLLAALLTTLVSLRTGKQGFAGIGEGGSSTPSKEAAGTMA